MQCEHEGKWTLFPVWSTEDQHLACYLEGEQICKESNQAEGESNIKYLLLVQIDVKILEAVP